MDNTTTLCESCGSTYEAVPLGDRSVLVLSATQLGLDLERLMGRPVTGTAQQWFRSRGGVRNIVGCNNGGRDLTPL